ncbi:hypothetical protein [Nostoc sp.]
MAQPAAGIALPNSLGIWLQSPELAITRVRRRVESGGHNIR